jgi:hypothetical protein
MASSINASTAGAGGVITTADNSGVLNLQSGGNTIATVQSTGFSLPSSATINAANTFGFENRIINGGMVIDQRNAGAVVTPPNGTPAFITDRWAVNVNQSSKLTSQQSATAPTGFINSLLVTSSSSYSIGATDYFLLSQKIEGLNIADLNWGTANAKTVTVSFWARSSLTGTFGGVIRNSGNTQFYPFTYTINAANTWEYETITIAGSTTGTWLTTNGTGLELIFGLGVGTTYSGTAGSWSGTFALSATGATSVVGTNGATLYITGVQLEVGSQATNFDVRSIGQEFLLCQRYYQNSYGSGEAITSAGAGIIYACSDNVGNGPGTIIPVPMRTSPTIYVRGTAATTTGYCVQNGVQRVASAAGQTNVRFAYLSVTGGVASVYTGASYEFIAEL